MFLKTCTGLTSLFIIILIVSFIYSFISPESYDKFVVHFDEKGGIADGAHNTNSLSPRSTLDYVADCQGNIYINKLTPGSRSYVIIPDLLRAVFILLVLIELIKFLNSVKGYSSFFVNNSVYFKRIGIYSIIVLVSDLIINSVVTDLWMKFPDGMISHHMHHQYNFPYYFLMCVIVCVSSVASQVFKEGEHLRIENELTV